MCMYQACNKGRLHTPNEQFGDCSTIRVVCETRSRTAGDNYYTWSQCHRVLTLSIEEKSRFQRTKWVALESRPFPRSPISIFFFSVATRFKLVKRSLTARAQLIAEECTCLQDYFSTYSPRRRDFHSLMFTNAHWVVPYIYLPCCAASQIASTTCRNNSNNIDSRIGVIVHTILYTKCNANIRQL